MVVDYHSKDTQTDEQISSDYVIVTVPVAILQKNTIQFEPRLPDHVQTSIDSLSMHGAVKVYMRFSRCFWPATLDSLYCCSGAFSQYWTSTRQKIPEVAGEDAEECPYFSLVNGSNQNGLVKMVNRADIPRLESCSSQESEGDLGIDDSKTVSLVCAFATADVASALCKDSPATIVSKSLTQLDEVIR